MKATVRKILFAILYPFYYKIFKGKINVARDGQPLLRGISAVVVAKNEEFTIRFCLESLVGFADQIICIDNGSQDRTLSEMQSFKERFGDEVQVDILPMPGKLLGECRDAGLEMTKHQWHLRWDADMVFHTDGPNSAKYLREKVMGSDLPRTIQLPRLNLFGDFNHTRKGHSVLDAGEPILVWFGRDILYREYGKFDAIKVPFYLKQVKERRHYYHHCAGLKSVDNLMNRFHYFTWREFSNSPDKNKNEYPLDDFELFKKVRNEYLLETPDGTGQKWRYMRQWAQHLAPYHAEKYGGHPKLIRDFLEEDRERFKVEYRGGQPYTVADRENEALQHFKPSEADLHWDPDSFFSRLKNEDL